METSQFLNNKYKFVDRDSLPSTVVCRKPVHNYLAFPGMPSLPGSLGRKLCELM